MNMKLLAVLAATVALSVAEAPRPSARLILLPRQSPAAPQTAAKPAESQSARVLDSGEYYVVTPEGKLQMVKYTTAALQDRTRAAQAAQAAQVAQFQPEYLQYPGFQAQPSQVPAQAKADYKKISEDAADFEAKVEFRDVKPIPAPIYAYNPQPLIRILKK